MSLDEDLSKVYKPSSLVNHSWLTEGEFYSPSPIKEPMEDQLARIWSDQPLNGYTGFNPNRETPYVSVDDAGEVHLLDKGLVVPHLKKSMMEGLTGLRLAQSLKDKFPVQTIAATKDEIRSVMAEHGLLGPVYLEIGDNFSSCEEANSFFVDKKANAPYLKKMGKCSGCLHFDGQNSRCTLAKKQLVDEVTYSDDVVKASLVRRVASGKISEDLAQQIASSDLPNREKLRKANLHLEKKAPKVVEAYGKENIPRSEHTKKQANLLPLVRKAISKGASVDQIWERLATKATKSEIERIFKEAFMEEAPTNNTFHSCKDPRVSWVTKRVAGVVCAECSRHPNFICGLDGTRAEVKYKTASKDINKVASELTDFYKEAVEEEVSYFDTGSSLPISHFQDMEDWVLDL